MPERQEPDQPPGELERTIAEEIWNSAESEWEAGNIIARHMAPLREAANKLAEAVWNYKRATDAFIRSIEGDYDDDEPLIGDPVDNGMKAENALCDALNEWDAIARPPRGNCEIRRAATG